LKSIRHRSVQSFANRLNLYPRPLKKGPGEFQSPAQHFTMAKVQELQRRFLVEPGIIAGI
jgi:hypothetical protein